MNEFMEFVKAVVLIVGVLVGTRFLYIGYKLYKYRGGDWGKEVKIGVGINIQTRQWQLVYGPSEEVIDQVLGGGEILGNL